MTVRELAKYLAGQPESYQDLPVLINGWGSDEGTPFIVDSGDPQNNEFFLDYIEVI